MFPVSRVTGMHPGADHFGLYTLEIWLLHWWGETITIAMMGLFMNANLAQSVTALVQAASVISSSGFLKYARLPNAIRVYVWLRFFVQSYICISVCYCV